MLKIFVLEDSEIRIKAFEQNLNGEGFSVTIAESFDDAMVQWGDGDYDVVFLDNDLGQQVMVGPEEHNSGLNFARHKVEELKNKFVFVHSLNTDRRKDIVRLVNGYEMPYTTFNWERIIAWLKAQAAVKDQHDLHRNV